MNPGELRLPGIIDSISQVVEFARDAAEQTALSAKARHGLLLAVDEIATNIVRHGYEEVGTTGDIELSAIHEDGYLVVTLIDTGPAFDPTAKPKPDSLSLPFEKRPVGGLGIYLALQQIDKFQYERRDGRNVSRLMVHL